MAPASWDSFVGEEKHHHIAKEMPYYSLLFSSALSRPYSSTLRFSCLFFKERQDPPQPLYSVEKNSFLLCQNCRAVLTVHTQALNNSQVLGRPLPSSSSLATGTYISLYSACSHLYSPQGASQPLKWESLIVATIQNVFCFLQSEQKQFCVVTH